ncbi:hypothetical protein B0H13DRAFT_2295261 [Mycena leptocephala]|nr:hypothetical protein B0H13DRAFT_2295261 [Mycena leptocephala]
MATSVRMHGSPRRVRAGAQDPPPADGALPHIRLIYPHAHTVHPPPPRVISCSHWVSAYLSPSTRRDKVPSYMQWALDGRLTDPPVKESRKSREGGGGGWEGAEEKMGGSQNMSQRLINEEKKGEGSSIDARAPAARVLPAPKNMRRHQRPRFNAHPSPPAGPLEWIIRQHHHREHYTRVSPIHLSTARGSPRMYNTPAPRIESHISSHRVRSTYASAQVRPHGCGSTADFTGTTTSTRMYPHTLRPPRKPVPTLDPMRVHLINPHPPRPHHIAYASLCTYRSTELHKRSVGGRGTPSSPSQTPRIQTSPSHSQARTREGRIPSVHPPHAPEPPTSRAIFAYDTPLAAIVTHRRLRARARGSSTPPRLSPHAHPPLSSCTSRQNTFVSHALRMDFTRKSDQPAPAPTSHCAPRAAPPTRPHPSSPRIHPSEGMGWALNGRLAHASSKIDVATRDRGEGRVREWRGHTLYSREERRGQRKREKARAPRAWQDDGRRQGRAAKRGTGPRGALLLRREELADEGQLGRAVRDIAARSYPLPALEAQQRTYSKRWREALTPPVSAALVHAPSARISDQKRKDCVIGWMDCCRFGNLTLALVFLSPSYLRACGRWRSQDKRGVACTATVGQEESKADPLTPALYTHWPHAYTQRTKHKTTSGSGLSRHRADPTSSKPAR